MPVLFLPGHCGKFMSQGSTRLGSVSSSVAGMKVSDTRGAAPSRIDKIANDYGESLVSDTFTPATLELADPSSRSTPGT